MLKAFEGDNTVYNTIMKLAHDPTGVKDPGDDATWQVYLDGLNSLHLDEWTGSAQDAYDRMK